MSPTGTPSVLLTFLHSPSEDTRVLQDQEVDPGNIYSYKHKSETLLRCYTYES